MKRVLCALAILCILSAPIYAQNAVSGTWQAVGLGPQPWTLVLSTEGSRLTGSVSSCASISVDIFDGAIDGSTITFKCQSLDGDRIITFRGVIKGDEIAFTWTKQVRAGGLATAPEGSEATTAKGTFGSPTPKSFVAKRVADRAVEYAAAVNLVQRGVKVEGTLLLPLKVRRIRSVIVVINYGLGGTFRSDPQLQETLDSLEAGLVGARITSISQAPNAADNRRIDVIRSAGVGGADGLLLLLNRLAQESGHSEVANAPLLLWGHSAAGSFAATFAALHPERTVAFVRYHSGGPGILGSDVKILKQIPALLLVAGMDAGSPEGEMAWRSGRALGAPWTFVVETNASHGDDEALKAANSLVLPWIKAVLKQRILSETQPLQAITDTMAWMGNNQTGEVAPTGKFSASKSDASWLPDEASARAWQALRAVGK